MRITDFAERIGMSLTTGQAAFVAAAVGDPLTPEQAEWLGPKVGRSDLDWSAERPSPQIMGLVKGRQCGCTTRVAATLALYRAVHPETTKGLPPGEHVVILCVAPSQTQAKILYRKLSGVILDCPMLRRELVGDPTQSETVFKNGVIITVRAANSDTLRGVKCGLLICDESAFFTAEGKCSDKEIVDAMTPALTHVPGAQILMLSSPWTMDGYFYELFRDRAQLDGVMFCQAASWELYPDFDKATLAREKERDPEVFQREYAAQFIANFERYLPGPCIEACINRGVVMRPPRKGFNGYMAAADFATRRDKGVLVIGHREADQVVVDCIETWSPSVGRPIRVHEMLAATAQRLRDYRVKKLHTDQWGTDFTAELLRQQGLGHREMTFTAQSKPTMYDALRELIVGERIQLLDHRPSVKELRNLEVRRTPSGGVKIEAPIGRGMYDDHADALAILSFLLVKEQLGDDGWVRKEKDHGPDVWDAEKRKFVPRTAGTPLKALKY